MNKFVTFCSLLMGGALLVVNWQDPSSVIMWFASTDQQFAIIRAAVVAMLAFLLVASSYADNVAVRRVSGLVSLALVYGAVQVLLTEPVFVLDLLFMLGAAISFGLVALHRPIDMHSLPRLSSRRRSFTPLADIQMQR